MADWGMPGISGMTANGIYNYMNEKIMQKDMHEGIKTIGEAILRHRESSKTAVICEDREMSYSRLCDEGMRIAWGLAGRGIKKGDRVAIDMERSESYISVLLGIALAGCVGINIHKSWPPKYRESVLSDCSPVLMIRDELAKELGSVAVECPLPTVYGNDPYFITYTSGSTGSPKGGVTFHEALLNSSFVSDQNIRNNYVVGHCERHLIDINFSYIASLIYLMLALVNEKTAVLATEDEMAFPALLGSCIQRNRIDHIFRVPSALLRALDDTVFSEAVKELKACSTGGEQITVQAARIISEHMPKAVLFCTYGSTELLMVSACVYQPGEQDLLGTPYENTSLYVIDEKGGKVPEGSEGELCIGGMAAQVGCYWNAPELTASKYELHPEFGRLFHSGDRVRAEGKGRLRMLGRLDGMIKLFGRRIDPEEIERALLSYPGIREAAVAVIGDEAQPELTAYYVAEDRDPDEGALRRHLVSLLPYYMIPVRMVSLEKMPLNMNGKLDRKALKGAQARRRVSVLTPIRNTPVALFERAFESLRKQSFGFTEIEWVIVLHNCTDSYKEDICNRLNGYPNIHIYISDVPGTNIGYARNQTLARATGEYIFFMDADDEMRPDCIEKVIRKMEESGADTSVMDSMWHMHGKGIPYWTDGDPNGENIYKKGDPNIGKSLCLSGLTLWTRCYRRRFLAEEGLVFDETRENGEDFFFNLEATGKANLLAVLPGYCGYDYYSGIGMTKEVYRDDLNALPESELIFKVETESKLFAEVYYKGTEAGLFMDNYLWFTIFQTLRSYQNTNVKIINILYSKFEGLLVKMRPPEMIWSERQPMADFISQSVMEGYNEYIKLHYGTAGEAILRYKDSDKPAVICADRELSYRNLCILAKRIAHGLMERGIKKGDRIAIDMKRSEDYICVLAGAALCGAISVTLHPGWSQKHRQQVLSDCTPKFIIDDADAQLLKTPDREAEAESPDEMLQIPMLSGSDPFFIIYTSGSTGSPKGVVISHELIRNSCSMSEKNLRNHSIAERCDRVLIDFNFSYVAGNYFTMLALWNHMTAVLATEDEIGSPGLLGQCIMRNRVDYQYRVPSWMLNALKDPIYATAMENIKVCDIGGEMLSDSTVAAVRASMPQALLYCSYGSSEAVAVAERIYQPGEQDLLGTPCENVRIYILDEDGTEVKENDSGELCIGGPAGEYGYYWNAPELTESKYKVHPEYGRLLHTGDLVRVEPGHRFRIIGRSDGMIKLYGQKIEAAMVEKAFLSFPGIWEAAVVLCGEGKSQRLAGYYTRRRDTAEGNDNGTPIIEEIALRRHLANELPYYMIPSYLIEIDSMPLNASGKLDRKALPAVKVGKTGYQAPETEREQILCEAYGIYLKTEEVGRYDSFFELGGNSIIAMQMLMYLSKERGLDLSIRTLFTYPRVCDLAAVKEGEQVQNIEIAETAEEDLPKEIKKLKDDIHTEAVYPVDSASAHLLFLSESNTEINRGVTLKNRVDISRTFTEEEFIERVNIITGIHPVLRSYFIKDEMNRRYQIFQKEAKHHLYYKDIRNLSPEAAERFLAGFFSVMDINDDMFQVACFIRGEKSCTLLLSINHSLLDGMSLSFLINELACDELVPAKDEFYAIRMKRLEEKHVFPKELQSYYKDYWKEKHVKLPIAGAVGGVRERRFIFSAEETSLIKAESAREGVSMASFIEYSYGMGILRALQRDEIWMGHVYSGRGGTEGNREHVLGNLFLNLPVKIRKNMSAYDYQQELLIPWPYQDITETEEYLRLNKYKDELGISSRLLWPYDKNVLKVTDDYDNNPYLGHYVRQEDDGLCIHLSYLGSETTDKAYDIIEEVMNTYLRQSPNHQ